MFNDIERMKYSFLIHTKSTLDEETQEEKILLQSNKYSAFLLGYYRMWCFYMFF